MNQLSEIAASKNFEVDEHPFLREDPYTYSFDDDLANDLYLKHLDRTYGLSLEGYYELLVDQDYRCAICNRKPSKRLVVDHDHTTEEVRSLLCNRCNIRIGLHRQADQMLPEEVAYLTAHGSLEDHTNWTKRKVTVTRKKARVRMAAPGEETPTEVQIDPSLPAKEEWSYTQYRKPTARPRDDTRRLREPKARHSIAKKDRNGLLQDQKFRCPICSAEIPDTWPSVGLTFYSRSTHEPVAVLCHNCHRSLSSTSRKWLDDRVDDLRSQLARAQAQIAFLDSVGSE